MVLSCEPYQTCSIFWCSHVNHTKLLPSSGGLMWTIPNQDHFLVLCCEPYQTCSIFWCSHVNHTKPMTSSSSSSPVWTFWPILSLSERFWFSLSHYETLWVCLNNLGPVWAFVNHSIHFKPSFIVTLLLLFYLLFLQFLSVYEYYFSFNFFIGIC